MQYSACLLMTLWLINAGLPAYAGNYTCHSCGSDVEAFYCSGCDQPVEPDGHELTPHGPSIRAQALTLEAGVNVSPSSDCSKATRFNLHNLTYSLSVYYQSENPLNIQWMMEHLFSDDDQYNQTHHVLFLNTPKDGFEFICFLNLMRRLSCKLIASGFIFRAGAHYLNGWLFCWQFWRRAGFIVTTT